MQAVEQNKTERGEKTKERRSVHLQCSLFLFMKALPGTMEINYLLTMWNTILFTRLRIPLLFQMRFFTASSFVSHSIIVSIFQNQSVSRKEQKKRQMSHCCSWNKPLGIFMNAHHINHQLQTPPPPPSSSNPPISSVISVAYPPQFYLKPNTVCSTLEYPLLQAALGEAQSE